MDDIERGGLAALEQTEAASASAYDNNVNNINSNNCNSRPANKKTNDAALFHRSKWILTFLIIGLGLTATSAFLSIGINSTKKDSTLQFEREAQEDAFSVESAWHDYELFGLWIHESCFQSFGPTAVPLQQDVAGHLGYCNREQFHRLYQHIQSVDLSVNSIQLLPNITNAMRPEFERQGEAYYQEHYPETVNYQGIKGIHINPTTKEKTIVSRREQPFYFPVMYVEPVAFNKNTIGMDVYNPRLNKTIEKALSTWKPVLSIRLKLITENQPDAYGLTLLHPGIPVEGHARTTALSQVVIRIPDFLDRATQGIARAQRCVYIFDSTPTGNSNNNKPLFLGGVQVLGEERTWLPEVELADIPHTASSHFFQKDLLVADRQWTIAVVSDSYQADLVFVIVGGTIVIAATLLLVLWFHTNLNRAAARSQAQVAAAAASHNQVLLERELNEYISHEIRNPLSSAISALSFVRAGVMEEDADDKDEESLLLKRQSLLSDIKVADSSLQFINELLRNMLDVHRAASKQIKLTLGPVDIVRDVLEPVVSILFMRGANVAIEMDCCPHHLFVNSDRMRLKQIVLNLAANATKFVQQGFIRLRAAVVNSVVELYVEDSGPGIPESKRDRLFAKFQESLDSLNQGTGIGLSVCKNLCKIMNGEIFLDESYDSGIEGCPGTRFVIRLNQPPLDMEDSCECSDTSLNSSGASTWTTTTTSGDKMISPTPSPPNEEEEELTLPDFLSVLFVDDDTVLRKLFTRALRRCAPNWDTQEAGNGETALRMVESNKFDVIFVDQYMASIEKQLLGTETVRAMRAKGVESIISGLSANDLERQFIEAGANTFMSKPFPCEKVALKKEMLRILQKGEYDRGNGERQNTAIDAYMSC